MQNRWEEKKTDHKENKEVNENDYKGVQEGNIERSVTEAEVKASKRRMHNRQEEHEHHDENKIALKKTEVITGKEDDGYTEIKFLDSVSAGSKIALNAAYYLMADLSKEQTEHHH